MALKGKISKIKLCALVGIALSVLSLLVHLHSTKELIQHTLPMVDFYPSGQHFRYRSLWGPVSSLEELKPYANPRSNYPVPSEQNGFIYAKIYGGFDKIRSSICDLVAVSRLLNATLVLPEIQQSLRSKSISPKFKSFSYLYDEGQFIGALSNDVRLVKSLPDHFKKDRKKNKFPIFMLTHPETPTFYIKEVLPKLKQSKVAGLVIADGGCLESNLPPSMAEYQRLRCRVAFHALRFRPEILEVGNQIVGRLRNSDRPYLAFHPGLVRDTLAFHGCAELFQDIHTELIQYRRKQMIKRGIVHEKLDIDSVARKRNGSCPLMPEEVGIILQAMGYPPNTIIYLAGSETFGGQRVLIPLKAMYPNLLDRTSVCSKKELSDLLGPESPLPSNLRRSPPSKSPKELAEEWKNAGPRPRPLPPPPARPVYWHEKEGWYGWVAETDREPEPTLLDLRMQAHRLIWDAVDYYVSVEADAFFPGFHNDGSMWPDFSSLVMGHRLNQMASGMTYRPDRRTLARFFDMIGDRLYHPPHNWTTLVREHLNRSLGMDGLIEAATMSKPKLFLSHPVPECCCRMSTTTDVEDPMGDKLQDRYGELFYGGEEKCPGWMVRGLAMVLLSKNVVENEGNEATEPVEDDRDADGQLETDDGSKPGPNSSPELDEEMDPDD